VKILITGAAGFIGYHLSKRLCKEGHDIVGIDNLNNYYSISLKKARLQLLHIHPNFTFFPVDITDRVALPSIFKNFSFDKIIHLAAEVGVRSAGRDLKYIDTNLLGFSNVIENAKKQGVSHFIFASSSAVYGNSEKYPSSEKDPVDQPISLYAATKKSNELMAHSYAHLYDLKCTGLRFFTVYGPWGRPDMAYYKFTQKIINEEPVEIYHQGDMFRDFTYIDDIIEGLCRIIYQKSPPPFRIYNIGRGEPIKLLDFISLLEKNIGKNAIKTYCPLQAGDVLQTWADTSALTRDFQYQPEINFETGIRKFVEWYQLSPLERVEG
jgi:UDP-glucuronate 4-epimerase